MNSKFLSISMRNKGITTGFISKMNIRHYSSALISEAHKRAIAAFGTRITIPYEFRYNQLSQLAKCLSENKVYIYIDIIVS